MRVIAGRAKGRSLKGPPARLKGAHALGVRPSSDLVRGALFSALEAMGADFSRTLDLFAGTGALGIEALSRGAESCDFVEKDRAMADVVRENLRLTGFAAQAKVYPIAVERALERLSGPYTLVLADPPYADRTAWKLLEAVAGSGLVTPGETTIAVEHSAKDEPRGDLGPFHLAKVLRHGDSAVSVYSATADSGQGGEDC